MKRRTIKSVCMICLLFITIVSCSKNDIKTPGSQDGFESGSFKDANIDEQPVINLEKKN